MLLRKNQDGTHDKFQHRHVLRHSVSPFAHIKCLLECKESRWEVVSYVLVGSQDTMEIDCMWNHYFLTVIDAQSLCILSSLL